MIESCYAGATPTLSNSVIAAGVECQDKFINLFRLIGDLPISQRKKEKKKYVTSYWYSHLTFQRTFEIGDDTPFYQLFPIIHHVLKK
jgi:hypothetical protein